MNRKIVAIGGGGNGRLREDGTYAPYETGPMDIERIKLTGKEKPNFLFLAHSQDTEEAQEYYFKTMKKIYGEMYGCECKDIKSTELSNKEKVAELIEWADIIYEGGGNTLDMIKLWQETGFDQVLRKAWEDGKVMCGVSAGANCWFKECSSDALQIKFGKDQPLIKVDCIGLVAGLYVPHCDAEGRLENVKCLLKESEEIGLSISNCCALEIVDDKYRLIISKPAEENFKPYGLKTYWKDKEYIEQYIDDSFEFKSFSELVKRNV